MPQDKSESDGNTSSDPPPDKDGDDVEFVEVDPTGRYGRVSDCSSWYTRLTSACFGYFNIGSNNSQCSLGLSDISVL